MHNNRNRNILMEEYVIVNNKLLHLESEYGYVESLLHTPRAMIRFIVENPDLQQERLSILPLIKDLFDSSHDASSFNRQTFNEHINILKENILQQIEQTRTYIDILETRLNM